MSKKGNFYSKHLFSGPIDLDSTRVDPNISLNKKNLLINLIDRNRFPFNQIDENSIPIDSIRWEFNSIDKFVRNSILIS